MGTCWTSPATEQHLADQPVVFKATSPRHIVAEPVPGYCLDEAVTSKSTSKGENITEPSTPKDGAEDEDSQISRIAMPAAPCREGVILQQSTVKKFGFNELKRATGDFHKDYLLGKGGFGPVFMGWVDEHTLEPSEPGSGMVVAVKMLGEEAYQGHSQWLTEVNYLGHLNHANLVKLIGYCLEGNQRLLVYEYMPRGSLEDHLFGENPDFKSLSWEYRLKVALDAAKGLEYLHCDDIKVIHRDFKSSNILLDTGFNAKLSDFGLVIDAPPGDKTHLSLSKVLGTYGYVDPAYLASGRLTIKSDVYSFGVVLLEILSGRHAIDTRRPPEERDLVRWAMPCFKNQWCFLNIVMDKRIEGQYSEKVAVRVAQIAGICLSEDPKKRPVMKKVVAALEVLQLDKQSSYVSSR